MPSIEGLARKYRAIHALRVVASDDPRDAMRALAAEHPGALRELDELPLELVEERLAVLERCVEETLPPPRWARALLGYHGWMRAALSLKRRFRRDADAARAWIARDYRPRSDEPSADALDAAVESVLRPPGGRLSRWVIARVAEELGDEPAVIEAEAFPPSPARRACAERLSPRGQAFARDVRFGDGSLETPPKAESSRDPSPGASAPDPG